MIRAMLRQAITVVAATLGLSAAAGSASQVQPTDAGRELRRMFMGKTARDLGVAPTPEFPKVFAVAMDWPLDDQIVTVVAIADGHASLYTTSTFGIIGGQNRPSEARKFVAEAQSHYDRATPTTTFPYPSKTAVRFYLLGYDGVRFVEGALDPIWNNAAPLSPLFGAAQDVVTALHQKP